MYDTIKEKTQELGVMSVPQDLILAGRLLRKYNQSQGQLLGMELGAGGGGWEKAMHELNVKSVDWVLVEDFRWVKNGYHSPNHSANNWPTTGPQLIKQLRSYDETLSVKQVIDLSVKEMIEQQAAIHFQGKINLLRIDCDITSNQFMYITQTLLTDNAVIFIDDTKPNCGLSRVMLAMEFMMKGLIHPIWWGQKESAFCIDRQTARRLANKLHNDNIVKDNMAVNLEGLDWLGRDYQFISTTENGYFK